ncbi:hypothetical protein A5647_20380 [Mycobacterium sp. 1100029.7]|nr:hypothetical protein A5647_20380 [Mycobacterium sp. 1100029.7]
MGVTVLASGDAAYVAGKVTFALTIPLIGVVCLLIGLRERNRSRARRPYYPYPSPMRYPGQPYPGHPSYFSYPPPVPRRRASGTSTTLITVGALVLAFGIFVALGTAASGLHDRSSSDAGMQMGQCFTESDLRTQFHNSLPTDCGDLKATYQLVAQGGPTATCPDGRRESSVYEVYTNAASTLCFAANLRTGQCYMKMDDEKLARLSPADCDDARHAQLKVLKRIDGSTDATQCALGAKGISYPTPARVYCVVEVGS